MVAGGWGSEAAATAGWGWGSAEAADSGEAAAEGWGWAAAAGWGWVAAAVGPDWAADRGSGLSLGAAEEVGLAVLYTKRQTTRWCTCSNSTAAATAEGWG